MEDGLFPTLGRLNVDNNEDKDESEGEDKGKDKDEDEYEDKDGYEDEDEDEEDEMGGCPPERGWSQLTSLHPSHI